VRPALPFLWLVGQGMLLGAAPLLGGASLALYALASLAEAVRVGRRLGPLAIPVVWAIFPVLHASHGAGFGFGLVEYARRPDWGAPERLRERGRSV
jgi:hypothetical protein